MKRTSCIAVLLVLLMISMLSIAQPVQAAWYCNTWLVPLSPTLQKICLQEYTMDHWDPLDWGTGDADNYDGACLDYKIMEIGPGVIDIYDHTYTEIPRAG